MGINYNNFSKYEMDIINRGKNDQLKNIDEMNYYYYYLCINKKKYIRDFKKRQFKNSEYWAAIICWFVVFAGCAFYNFILGNINLTILFGSSAVGGVILVNSLCSYCARKIYKNQVRNISYKIECENIRINKERELEKERRKINEERNSKKDGFILNIVDDIKIVLSSKYDGYKKDILALKTLGYKYLKLKELLKTTSALEMLSMYPEFNSIILGIEENINKNIKFKESQDLDISELCSVLGEFNNQAPAQLMSNEELFGYIQKMNLN